MSANTPTPRTDAARIQGHPSLREEEYAWVICRQIERELIAAQNEIARLNGQTRFLCQCGGVKPNHANTANTAHG